MGEFRDMRIPAQVVKKKSCTSGEAASAGFFFCHACRNSQSLYSPIQERYSSMSHYIINIFWIFLISRDFFVKPLPPACSHVNSNMSSQRNFRNPTHAMDQKLSMQQDLPPGLGLAGPSVQKNPKKFHQIAKNKQEKIVKKIFLKKFDPPKKIIVYYEGMILLKTITISFSSEPTGE
jgi:hypothetical protein